MSLPRNNRTNRFIAIVLKKRFYNDLSVLHVHYCLSFCNPAASSVVLFDVESSDL